MHGIYLNCSEVPYRAELFFELIDKADSAGSGFFLFNPGQFFPWSSDFHLNPYYSYPEEFFQRLEERAGEKGVEIIPVLDTDRGADFVIKEPFYRFMVPDFPKNTEIDFDSAGTSLFFENMMEDMFSLLPKSRFILIRTSGGSGEGYSEKNLNFLVRMAQTASVLGKKIIFVRNREFPVEDIPSAGGSFHEENNASSGDVLELKGVGRIPVWEANPDYPFIPFSGLMALCGDGAAENEYKRDKELLSEFLESKRAAWESCSTFEEEFSLIFAGSGRGSVVRIFDRFAAFEDAFQKAEEGGNRIISAFASQFEGQYVENMCLSVLEPLETALERAKGNIKKIKRRLL